MIRETIILAPGADRTEMIRSLALHGQGSFAVRIYSSAFSLADDMLMRKGVIGDPAVSESESRYMISSCMKQVPAFCNASFADAVNLARALKLLRSLIVADERKQMEKLVRESSFAEKNRSLLEVYDRYREMLAGRRDSIDVIRQVIEKGPAAEAEFIELQEFPLLPLEAELLRVLSKDGVRKMSLCELFGVQRRPFDNVSFIRAYGNSNEVENTLNHIFENNISLDDCVIAVTDRQKYGQLLLEYCQKYDINAAFADGISITNTNPYRLLKLYHQWDVNGYHGADPLMAMLYAPCFDLAGLQAKLPQETGYRIFRNTVDRVGQLKLGPDRETNLQRAADYLPLIGKDDRIDPEVIRLLAQELGRDCCSFISEYALIRSSEDEEALRLITNVITGYLRYNPEGSYADVYDTVVSNRVGRSASRQGSLIVTDIPGALSCCRRHLFVIGLSAGNFPGAVRENYLLLDDDLKLYGNDVPLSSRLIERKKSDLFNLLELNSAIGADIRLSYSCYDMAAIKEENASSVLFEIYRIQNPDSSIEDFEELLKKGETSYLQNRLSVSSQVISSLTPEQMIEQIPRGDVTDRPYEGIRSFSPSALESFFSCPKRFYLTNILGIEEPDPDDPFTVIDARDMGTLVHEAMEYLAADPDVSPGEFKRHAEDMFANFLKTRTPVNAEAAEVARKEFMNMAVNGYRNDPHNRILAAEKTVRVTHRESGIEIFGIPDRVEIDTDGRYLIADYKTKRRIEHVDNDIDTCIQVVLYAYMMKYSRDYRLPIAYCTYRYLRYRRTVNCVYDDAMEQQLAKKMMEVKTALDEGHFPCLPDEDNCRYCRFASICGKEREDEVAENE